MTAGAAEATAPTRTLEVALGERSYPIHIGAGVLAQSGALIADRIPGKRVVIVSNPVVATHWLAPLQGALTARGIASETVIVPDGEAHKTWDTLHEILGRLLEMKVDRSTALVALGGGVIGDLAGFAAAIYQRGIAFVQVPTTLLAQVDSSVGGKTGVNHALGKNMIGAFHQPAAVLIDTDCLRTLPAREMAAGIAEVVKYGCIRDAAFFAWLETSIEALAAREPRALAHAIFESCRIKAAVVAADERETGERAILNFGHTFGHAIEAGLGFGTWLHGEAVAAGMVMAARLSAKRGELPAKDAERIARLIERARLPIDAPKLGASRYIELMARDKKVLAGAVRFVVLRALGDAYVTADVSELDLLPLLE